MRTLLMMMDFSFRLFVLLLCLTFGVIFLFAGARNALAAELRPVTTLTGDVLRVGDLFDGLSSEKAAMVLGPAPQPGSDMVLNARTLMRIASALDLAWRPENAAEQIIIRRAATVVDSDVIKALVNEKLVESGLNGNFNMNFVGALPQIVLPHDQAGTAEISSFAFNPKQDTFQATLSSPSAANPLRQVSVAGSVQRLVALPVLKTTLRNGDIIGAADIDYVDLDAKQVQRDYMLKEADLIGMTPRRMVMSGKPIRDIDLQNPQLVGRGEAITLVYNDGTLALTAKGKAMQAGAKGDIIRVINVNSNRPLEGMVTASREVTLSP